MKFSRLIPAPKEARNAARFAELFLMDQSVRDFFAQDSMSEVVIHAKRKDWAAAAKEFRVQTGCDIQMSVYGAMVATKL